MLSLVYFIENIRFFYNIVLLPMQRTTFLKRYISITKRNLNIENQTHWNPVSPFFECVLNSLYSYKPTGVSILMIMIISNVIFSFKIHPGLG